MSSVERIRVTVLHGDPVARAGLCVAFGNYPDFQMQEAPDEPGDDSRALELPRLRFAQVVVADYSSGLALAAHFGRRDNFGASPKVVVIGGIDREWEIRCAMEQGVRGYLLVGCPLDELVAGVRAVHRGGRYLSPQVALRLAEHIALEPLTAREAEVLRLVVAGLCNKAISNQLAIAVGTVKSHLKATFEKLHVESRTQAIAVAERRGLLCQPAPRHRRWSNPEGTQPARHPAGIHV